MSRTHHPKFRQNHKTRWDREHTDQRTRLLARLSWGDERIRGRRRSRKVRDRERWVDKADFTWLLRERLITEPPWRQWRASHDDWAVNLAWRVRTALVVDTGCEP